MRISRNDLGFWGSLATLIVLSYAWRAKVLTAFPLIYDEGIHLILGKLWAAGYLPYEEIFVSYPPSFLWSLGIPWQLFNQPGALQLLMVTYSLAAVIAVVYIGSVYQGRLAGLIAGTLLSFTPAYFIPSFTIMTEVPSISIAVAAIALAEKYRRSRAWMWALITGAVLGFGLSLKILPYYAVPLIGLMVISSHVENQADSWSHFKQSIPKLLRDIMILAGGFLITFALPILFFDVPSFYEQVIGMRLNSREVDINPFESNHDTIRDFLFSYPGLTALALYGTVFVIARQVSRYWLLVIWFALVWISMAYLNPLRAKHLPIFLPLLTILAGFAGQHMVQLLRKMHKQGGFSRRHLSLRSIAMLLTILMTLGIVLWRVPAVIAENSGWTAVAKENKERRNAIDFIDTIATPTDCVIADNPVFLHQTNRLPPPQLSETSQTRIDTGHLTLPDVIQAVEDYRCHVVAVVTPRFGESIPGLPEWLAGRYLGLYAQSETWVYFAPTGVLATQPLGYTPVANGNFDNLVSLTGVHLDQQPRPETDKVYVSLLWQLKSPLNEQFIEQIITVRSADDREYQIRRLPFEGLFNQASWQIDEQARDTFQIKLPADLPTGSYDLYLSLCMPETKQCLAANNQTELYLGQITVQP